MSLYNSNLELTNEQKNYALEEAMNQESSYIHGNGYFDIRYWILRNSSWTNYEKQKLINTFWPLENDFAESLNAWEWQIVNASDGLLSLDNIYAYTYEDILKIIQDKRHADKLWKDINFCRLAHKLRPLSQLTLKK